MDLAQSLHWIINWEKSELKPTQLFSFVSYEYHLDLALVKPMTDIVFKLQDLILKIKSCFDCKMFDVANWVAHLNREDGSGGSSSHETLSVASQRALEISSVTGHPPSLVRDHISSPRMVAKSCQRDEGLRLLSQRPQYPNLY